MSPTTSTEAEVRKYHRTALRALMNSPEWTVLAEYLQRFKELATIHLVAVKKEIPDDFLRGQIQVYSFLLKGLAEQLDQSEREELEQMELPLDGPPVDRGDPYGESTLPESE